MDSKTRCTCRHYGIIHPSSPNNPFEPLSSIPLRKIHIRNKTPKLLASFTVHTRLFFPTVTNQFFSFSGRGSSGVIYTYFSCQSTLNAVGCRPSLSRYLLVSCCCAIISIRPRLYDRVVRGTSLTPLPSIPISSMGPPTRGSIFHCNHQNVRT